MSAPRPASFPTIRVGGVPIALAGPKDLLRWVGESVEDPADGCRVVNHLAAHPTVLARRDLDLAATLERADCNVADGMGTLWAVRLLADGPSPTERVYGPDAMLATIEAGLPRRWRHAFVGGTQVVLPRLLSRLRDRYPGMVVAGAYSPPFRDVDAAAVSEDLDALGTHGDLDVLWVGLGVPKQIRWADLARRHAPARVIATVGAAFDFHAGVVPQAPRWMQEHGLEWLHRLGQDPRRLMRRYLVGNAQHVVGVAGDVWRQRVRG